MKRDVVRGLIAVSLVAALVFAIFGRTRRARSRADSSHASAQGGSGEEGAAHDQPVRDEPTEAPASALREAGDPARTTLDRAQRDELRALIWNALGHPAPSAAPPPSKGAPYVLPVRPNWPEVAVDGAFGRLDPQDIQTAVHKDFFPLAKNCYDLALAKDPTLEGTVVLAFNIVGDEKIGGIVEAVDVLDKSTLRDPDLIECMRQSFLSTTFPAPAGGGMVTVEYPIAFSGGDGGE